MTNNQPPKLPPLQRPSSNFSKVPHVLVDWLPHLNETGLKVVYYLLRHTWGWSEYDEPLALSMDEFANGIRYVTRTGEQGRLDGGTGLSENGVRDGLAQAYYLGLIEAVALDETPGKEQYAYRLVIGGGANSAPLQKMHPSVLKRVKILQGRGEKSAPVEGSKPARRVGRQPSKKSIKEKGGAERNSLAPDGEDSEPATRNYLYEAVVKYIWEVEDYSLIPNGEQGRPGVIAGYLFQQYKCGKSTDPNDPGVVQAVNDLPDFVWWYRKENAGHLPYVGDKFAEHFAKWVTKGRPRPAASNGNGKPTGEQVQRTLEREQAIREAEARGEL